MAEINKYGLSRYIDAPTKREVRQRCGFGCVICGDALYEYEHVDPTFENATCHDANHIALLCKKHHGEVTTNFRSKASVIEAMSKPKALQKGFAFLNFERSNNFPYVVIGGAKFEKTRAPITAAGIQLFTIDLPEDEGEPYLLSAKFLTNDGALMAEIERNEWRAYTTGWDVTAIGGVMTIRQQLGKISLQLRFVPGEGVIVENLNMQAGDVHIQCTKDELILNRPPHFTNFRIMAGAVFSNSPQGIVI